MLTDSKSTEAWGTDSRLLGQMFLTLAERRRERGPVAPERTNVAR